VLEIICSMMCYVILLEKGTYFLIIKYMLKNGFRIRYILMRIYDLRTVDPVIVVALTTHHSQTLKSHHDTPWIIMWFHADEYLLYSVLRNPSYIMIVYLFSPTYTP